MLLKSFWDSRHLIGVVVVHIGAAFIFILSESCSDSPSALSSYFFVEFSNDIGNPFSRRDGFTFLILYLGDEHPLLCRTDSWDVPYPFEVFNYSLDVLLSFHFFVSDTFCCIC